MGVGGFALKIVKDWTKANEYFGQLVKKPYLKYIDEFAQMGVEALRNNTPTDSGLTAASWYYEINSSDTSTSITWKNSNLTSQGDPIAIMLQYGHGTGTGGYVVGRDYINPAIAPVFDTISDGVWEVITSL